MTAALLAAALALGAGALWTQDASPRQAEPGAAPKAAVAGMAGFRSRSRVRLASEPEQVVHLEAYYVFPERVRWSLLPEGAAATERQLYFRFGGSYWTLAPSQARSRALGIEDGERLDLLTEVHMELRRAAMLWPDGLDWEGGAAQRSAKTRLRAHSGVVSLLLDARLDATGRPREIHVRRDAADGGSAAGLALVDITWREQGERWWPHTFTLTGYGSIEWHETVESIETAVNALDSFFVPPDRRGESGATGTSTPLLIRLPPVTQKRLPLPPGTPWQEALQRAAHLAAEEAQRLEPLGGQLQRGLVLELDGEGAPTGVLLRLARPPDPLPEGWEPAPAREAATAPRRGIGPVPAALLRRLRERIPVGAEASAPYVRIPVEGDGETTCQVVVPFTRPR